MVLRRVDVADPTSEGPRIADALRGKGFSVVEKSVESLAKGTDAALVVLAGDAAGSRDVLRALRGASATAITPVVVVGVPPEGPSDSAALAEIGADAFYARPVPVGRLVRKIETFFAPAEQRLTSSGKESAPEREVPGSGRPPREHTVELGAREADESVSEKSWNPPERTMELEGEESDSVPPLMIDPGEPEVVDAQHIARAPTERPVPPAESGGVAPPSSAPKSGPGHATTAESPSAEISQRLRQMLLEVDRRIFPNESPLDLRFSAGDDSPSELVPDELLDTVSLPLEAFEEDPLEAFTYLGGPPAHDATPLPTLAQARARRASAPPPRDRDTPTSAGASAAAPSKRVAKSAAGSAGSSIDPAADAEPRTQPELDVGEESEGGRRRGELDASGGLAVLWKLAERRVDARVAIDIDGETVELVLRRGRLASLDANIAMRVVEALRKDKRLDDHPADERQAIAMLERRVASGHLGQLEVDRRTRKARESLVHSIATATSGSFQIRPLEESGATAGHVELLGAALPAVLVEGARRTIGVGRLRALFGTRPLVLRLDRRAAERMRDADVEPELVALVTRHDGRSLDALLAEGATDDGLPGIVWALASIGAIALAPAGTGVAAPDASDAVRRTVEAAAALGDDADYFAILGVSPDAHPRAIRAAWRERRRELASLPLDALGLEALELLREKALEAIDEAYWVLRDDRLRAGYAGALLSS